jgi:SSS family transporter
MVITFYLPFFAQRQLTSVYEFLEARFCVSLRIFGALTFVGFQLGRIGITILLPALALSAVSGANIWSSILLIGLLTTAYTAMGGAEAVVWTDVVQTFVLVGGALAVLVVAILHIDGGFAELLRTAYDDGKLALFRDWNQPDLSLARDGMLVILLGAIFTNLLPYSSDQALVQRYLTVKDQPSARRAIIASAVLMIPVSMVFYAIGTALYVYFKLHPDELAPIEKSDQIFPWFIGTQMPAGFGGLVIAGLLAAAMSSLDSSMHSTATVISTDFYKRARPNIADRRLLSLARQVTVAIGIIGTATAILMASIDSRYFLDLYLNVVGSFLGPLAGVFALGVFASSCQAVHAWMGVIASVALSAYFSFWQPGAIHPLASGAVSMCTCLGVGLLTSVAVPAKQKARLDAIYDRAIDWLKPR